MSGRDADTDLLRRVQTAHAYTLRDELTPDLIEQGYPDPRPDHGDRRQYIVGKQHSLRADPVPAQHAGIVDIPSGVSLDVRPLFEYGDRHALISGGRNFIRTAPYLTLFPGLFIMITVLAFNIMGDGLRDALDPKLKR